MSIRHHKYERRDIVKHWIINLMLWCLFISTAACCTCTTTSEAPAARRINHHDFIKCTTRTIHRTSINMGGWYPQATIYYFDTKKKCILDWRRSEKKYWPKKYHHHKKYRKRFFILFYECIDLSNPTDYPNLFFFCVCHLHTITADAAMLSQFFVFKKIQRIWHCPTTMAKQTHSVFLWIGAKIKYAVVSQVIEINYLQSKSVTLYHWTLW